MSLAVPALNRLRLAVPSPFGWCLLFAVVSGFVSSGTICRLGCVFQSIGTLERFPAPDRMMMVFLPVFLFVVGIMAVGCVEVAGACPSLRFALSVRCVSVVLLPWQLGFLCANQCHRAGGCLFFRFLRRSVGVARHIHWRGDGSLWSSLVKGKRHGYCDIVVGF